MNENANKQRWYKSSTFFSLCVVMGVILLFVLMTIIPTIHNVIVAANRYKALTNLLQIEKGYDFYNSTSNHDHFTAQPGDTAHEFIVSFARITLQNDASLWFIKSDPRLDRQKIPQTVIQGDLATGTANPDFMQLPLSYEIVATLPQDGPPTTRPIAWTRGLQSDGTWSLDSPYKGEGGHIAYLDGHVEWATKFSSVKYGTTIPTTNIREALPPGAVILSAELKGLAR